MNELKVEVDAAEVGLDSERLKRIDAHFAGYVADGRLPGWLLTVRRHGRLAHVARCGSRDLEAGLPVTDDTVWRIYSMTKPVTSVAAMMLYEEGAAGAHRSGQRVHPLLRGRPRLRRRLGPQAGNRPRDRTGKNLAPAHPHRRAHLRLPPGRTRWTRCTGRRASSGARRRGADLAQACDLWAGFPLLFQPGTEWNYSVATDVLGRVVEVASGQRLDEFFADRIFAPARHDRHRLLGRPGGPAAAGRPLQPGAGRQGGQARRPRPGALKRAAHAQRGRRPGVHGGRLRPVHPDAAAPAGQPGRRAGRHQAAEPAHGRLHGPQPPSGRRGPGDLRPAAVRRGPVPRGRLRPRLRRPASTRCRAR